MPEVYDKDSFERSIIPNGFRREVRETIELAVMLGWVIHVTGGNSVTIVSPKQKGKPEKKYHFSTNRRATIPHNRIRRDIARLGDPVLVKAARSVADQMDAGNEEAAMALTGVLVQEGILKGLSEAETVDDRPPAQESQRKAERTVVSTTPMLAKAGSKHGSERAYESETTLERLWSDGTTDWVCAFPSCNEGPGDGPWQANSRLSVSRHYANAHSRGKGRAPQPPTFASEVPGAASYAPQQRRVDALAAFLEGLLSGGQTPTSEEVARAALTWVHDQTRHGTEFAAEREPMTPEDMLNRIRTLLDDGSATRHQSEMEELREQVRSMGDVLLELQDEVDVQRGRADAARQALKALADLAAEQAQGEESA